MSTADYANREVDVVAFQGSSEFNEQELSQVFFSETSGGNICTGVVMLAQKFLLKLFKIRGSKKFYPDEGNDFMLEAQTGGLRTPLDVFAAFSAALVDIRREFDNEETTDMPDDERYGDAQLIQALVSPGSLKIVFEMTSRAGTNTRFIAPIPVTVGK
jgi:hypothetical protein